MSATQMSGGCWSGERCSHVGWGSALMALWMMLSASGCAAPQKQAGVVSAGEMAAMAQQQRVRALYNDGAEEHADGDLAAAQRAYAQALALDPTFIPALENMAAIDVAEGRQDKARATYTRLVEIDPGNVTSRLALAQWAVQDKRYQDAIALCREALRVKPDGLLGYQLAAESYVALGDLARAELVVGRGLQWDANDAGLNRVAARILTKRHNIPAAMASLRAVLRADGKRDDVRAQLAELALDVGDYAGAIAELEILHKHRPNDVAVQIGMGVAYKGLGQFDKAQDTYSAVLEKDPAQTDAMWNLAVLYHDQLQRFDDAVALYKRLRPHTREDVAWTQAVAQRLEEAEKRGEDQRRQLAFAQEQQRRRDALNAACEALHRGDTIVLDTALGGANERIDAAWGLVGEAQSMATSGDVGKAKPLVACALRIIPYAESSRSEVCASIHVVWGQVLHDVGRLDDARQEVAAALVCDPSHVDAKNLAQQWEKSAQVTQ